jgi:hypothetical protein
MRQVLRVLSVAVLLVLSSAASSAESKSVQLAERAIDVLIDADIDLLDWTIFDAETDPNHLLGRPGQYIAKAVFWDARIGDVERGPEAGTVEIFRSNRDLLDRMKYIEEIGRKLPFLLQYQYRKGLALLRLSKKFTPAQAQEYEHALKKFK